MKKGISRLFAGECFLQNASFLCMAWKYSCYGKTWWFPILLIIPFYVYEMAKSASALCCFFCCFQTVFALTVCSLTEWEVALQVKAAPACLPAVMCWSQGSVPEINRGWLLLTHRGSTSSPLSWCLLLDAWVRTQYLKNLENSRLDLMWEEILDKFIWQNFVTFWAMDLKPCWSQVSFISVLYSVLWITSNTYSNIHLKYFFFKLLSWTQIVIVEKNIDSIFAFKNILSFSVTSCELANSSLTKWIVVHKMSSACLFYHFC